MTDLPNIRDLVLHDGDIDLDDVGGGSTAGAARVIAFPFAHDTAGLNAGVTVWTPAVGDVLLDAWVAVETAFNGTTPQADIGTFVNSTQGLVGYADGTGIFLDSAAAESQGDGVLVGQGFAQSMSSVYIGALGGTANMLAWQATFSSTNPLKLVVSQDARAGGDPIGGTTGAGTLYLAVATPA